LTNPANTPPKRMINTVAVSNAGEYKRNPCWANNGRQRVFLFLVSL
jgi:hypothetical protein